MPSRARRRPDPANVSAPEPPPREAALFRNGRNQAVRIPKEFEFDADRVRIRRDGAALVLEPLPGMASLVEELEGWEPLDVAFPDVDRGLRSLDADPLQP